MIGLAASTLHGRIMQKTILKGLYWATQELELVTHLTAESLPLRQQLLVLKRNQRRPNTKSQVAQCTEP